VEDYMNPNIFREYDIRGVVKDDFPEDVVFNIGRSYGSILIENNQKNISISGDVRYSTERLKNNLKELVKCPYHKH
jgi:phosphomannomutase